MHANAAAPCEMMQQLWSDEQGHQESHRSFQALWKRMLHADRTKNARNAQKQAGEMDEVERAHADAAVDAALAQHQNLEDADLDLPEAITNPKGAQ